jgi:4-amino-4-deoxy-L-arabinose transferase-like glycosyltransferase
MSSDAWSRTVLRGPVAEAVTAGAVAFALMFSGTSHLPIVNGDEARFAQASREMFASGDLVVPTFGGRNRYDKPPAIYWLTAASFALLDATPRAARLPSNLAAVATAALLALWVRRRAGPGAGLLAGTLLSVTPVVLVQGRSCTADTITVALTLVAMLALERILRGAGRVRDAIVLWAATALAILAKGPVAPMILAATGVGLWALSRRWTTWQLAVTTGLLVVGSLLPSPVVLLPLVAAAAVAASKAPGARVRELRWGLGAVIATVVLLPWTVAAWSATDGEFFRVAIGRHVVERGLSPLEGHAGFPGFYVVTAIALGFPWFGPLLAELPTAWRRRRDDATTLFLLAWLIAPVVVLEVVATKLVHYPMAVYPAAVAMVVLWAWRADSPRPTGPAIAAHAVGGLVLAMVPPAAAIAIDQPGLMPFALVASVVLLVGVAMSTAWMGRWPRRALVAAAVAQAGFMVVLMNGFVPRLGAQLIGPRLIARAIEVRGPADALVVYGLRDEEVLFHGPIDLQVCRSADELTAWMEAHPSTVALTRSDRLQSFLDERSEWRPVVVDRVTGFDLGRGQTAEGVIFRLDPPG